MTRTEKIRTKIETMEMDISMSHEETGKLEATLAEAYAADGDAGAAHKKLSQHREKLADMIAVVGTLDMKLRDTSITEAREIGESIAAEAERRRKRAESEIRKSLSALEKTAADLLPAGQAPRFVEDVIDDGMARYDSVLDTWSAEQRDARMPEDFSGAVPTREIDGRCFYESASGWGFWRDYRFARQKKGGRLTIRPHRLSIDADEEQRMSDSINAARAV